jgi:hypothetical protein
MPRSLLSRGARGGRGRSQSRGGGRRKVGSETLAWLNPVFLSASPPHGVKIDFCQQSLVDDILKI